MLTPQDIKEQQFVKAVIGGYDSTSVDEFFANISEDYAALFKENAVLKSKIKVLVEKVEEYRSTEESMRMALLTAQKMGNEIVDEANKKSKDIVAEAQLKSEQCQQDLDIKIKSEEKRLKEAQKTTSEFSKKILELYKQQLDYIHEISHFVVPEELKKSLEIEPVASSKKSNKNADTTIRRIPARKDDSTNINKPEEKVEIQADETKSSDNDKRFDDEKNEIARSISESLGDTTKLAIDPDAQWDDEDEPTTKRPSFNFDDLQFGKNFGEDK